MKKILSFAVAAAMAISSMSTLVSAASLYSFATERDDNGVYIGDKALNKYGVPEYDEVDVDLDIQTAWDDATNYTSHTSASPLKKTAERAIFDAKANLDMTEVAKEWNAYLEAAVDYAETNFGMDAAAARNRALEATKLTGNYTISITVPGEGSYDEKTLKGIENTKLAAQDSAGWEWATTTVDGYSYSATDFFDYQTIPTSYSEADGDRTFTINMKVKDDVDNVALDTYFNKILGENGKAYKNLTLLIPDNCVGTRNVTYAIDGVFTGFVKLTIGMLNLECEIDFGEVKDTDYVRLATSGGGGGGGSSVKPTPTPVPTDAPTDAPTDEPTGTPTETPEPQTGGSSNGATLNYDDHYAYIIGYPAEDGQSEDYREVRPQNNITRAEVATIFFRMLTDESRVKFWTQENSYSDVEITDWYNNAISTATNAGIIEGYDTGDFKPNNAITRAEFAAIAARFTKVEYTGEAKFSDISGHWAEEAINKAAATGWIDGYDDGTFRPDQYITRAEAMTLINRILYRLVDGEENLHNDMVKWIDNADTNAWYYENVQEATNTHDYEREAIGSYEKWTAMREPRDWEALEKETSTAASAGTEESVFETSDLEQAVE